MSASLVAACLWLVAANVAGLLPSRRKHWPQAWALIAVGLPILAWVAVDAGPWIASGVFLAAASVLRWPLRYLLRWIARALPGSPADRA